MSGFVEIEAVTRRFGGLTAVDSVSGRIEEGELVGLIGPNGAGKTTLFNVMTGFTPPSSGSVRFRGSTISGLAPWRVARLGVGRTFQNLRIFPNMTVFDNVSVGAIGRHGHRVTEALLRGAGARARSTAIAGASWSALHRTGLADQADELAANLSYGKRKYLEIARALATSPALLVLDEPAAGLNDSETAELARFIQDLNRGGITVLLVEHDMALVMGICRRVMVLASGRKIADAPPDAVKADPAVIEAYLGVEA
ncbi:MAG: ABC transporter ATP-binding protein [Acetobacteraceae bacterium]|nr:ABC transporter ATP-binding protein [Acetobacteraceae bacterium]